MNHREELRERYEDALFALLMDEIAEREAALAQAENQRLGSDPSAAVPEAADKRCLQLIRRHAAKQRARAAGRCTVRAVKYALLAAGLAATLFTAAFAASETVRVNTMSLIVKAFENKTVFELGQVAAGHPAPRFGVGWIPDGYELTGQGSDFSGAWFEYQRAENELIWIDYTIAGGTSISADTENAEIDYVKVHDTEAMLIFKDGSWQLIWLTEDHMAFICIIGEGTSREDILHVADQLIY